MATKSKVQKENYCSKVHERIPTITKKLLKVSSNQLKLQKILNRFHEGFEVKISRNDRSRIKAPDINIS